MGGVVEAILIAGEGSEPMVRKASVEAVEQAGLRGDRLK
jgi:hypothetical protein